MVPAASALLALRTQGQPLSPEAATQAGFAISVQCWTFREFSLWEAIEKAGAAGATAVELFPGQTIGGPLGEAKVDPGLPDAAIAQILEHAKKNGVAPVNYGVTGIDKKEEEARKTFEFAKKLGLYGITTESLDALDTLEKLAKEFDIRICFHNHPRPSGLWNPDTIWQALEGRDARLGYCADVGHWATSGLDPLEVVKKIATRVHSFHMKDREAVGKSTPDSPFGTGVIDIAAILDAVREKGFAGNVSIEYERNWKTSLPEVAQCVGYLRAYSKLKAKA